MKAINNPIIEEYAKAVSEKLKKALGNI
jgi:hypothetical protein